MTLPGSTVPKMSTSHEFTDIRQRFDEVDRRSDKLHDRINARFDRVEFGLRCMNAHSQNNALRNPALRITPLPTLDPTQDIIYPRIFPRHAKEFYALRNPSDDRHRKMLSYLVGFYKPNLSALEGSDGEDEDEDEDDESVEPEERAVELLEVILGLNEDNFIRFKKRSDELRLPALFATKRPQPPARDTKEPAARRLRPLAGDGVEPVQPRPQPPARDGEGPPAARRWQDLLPQTPAKDRSHSSEGLDNTRLVWRARTRSTPPSQRWTINNRPKAAVHTAEPAGEPAAEPAEERTAPASSASGASSSTRPFTNPREI
jgi:hypothetical protein